nr:G protein-coupled receptor 10 [Elephant endotheliotropic herpesvirus 1A]
MTPLVSPSSLSLMDNITGDYHDDDPCSLGFSILGLTLTLGAVALSMYTIKKDHLCVSPRNTLHLHFLLLICILAMFVLSSTTYSTLWATNSNIVTFLIQFPPAISICCILTLTINLFNISIYQHHFSTIFTLILPVLLVLPISIMFILYQFIPNKLYSNDNDYPMYLIENYALSNTYLYLDYLLTISMLLTLCLYTTLYGKLLCVTAFASWILWNIHWSIVYRVLTSYVYLTLGYILLFYIYAILMGKHFSVIVLLRQQMFWKDPPPQFKYSYLINTF